MPMSKQQQQELMSKNKEKAVSQSSCGGGTMRVDQSFKRKTCNRSVDESDQRRVLNRNRKSISSPHREFVPVRERCSSKRAGNDSEGETDRMRRSINTQEGATARPGKLSSHHSPSPSFSFQQRQDIMKAYTFKLDRQMTVKYTNSQLPLSKGSFLQTMQHDSVVSKTSLLPPASIEIFHEEYTHLKGTPPR